MSFSPFVESFWNLTASAKRVEELIRRYQHSFIQEVVHITPFKRKVLTSDDEIYEFADGSVWIEYYGDLDNELHELYEQSVGYKPYDIDELPLGMPAGTEMIKVTERGGNLSDMHRWLKTTTSVELYSINDDCFDSSAYTELYETGILNIIGFDELDITNIRWEDVKREFSFYELFNDYITPVEKRYIPLAEAKRYFVQRYIRDTIDNLVPIITNQEFYPDEQVAYAKSFIEVFKTDIFAYINTPRASSKLVRILHDTYMVCVGPDDENEPSTFCSLLTENGYYNIYSLAFETKGVEREQFEELIETYDRMHCVQNNKC